MAFETLRSLIPTPAVHAKPEAVRVKPDDQKKKQDGKGRQPRQPEDEQAHPVPNDQGQITGKVIDTTV
jgi:hypothetical protein